MRQKEQKQQATADNATALGKKATASGRDSIAAGATANASGTDSIATGHNANATGVNAVATGSNASAAGNAAAYGNEAKATGRWSSAFGNKSKATATDSSAFGNSANASAQNGTAIGSHSTVTAINGTALGNQAEVTSAGGVALGQGSKTTNKDGSTRQGLNKDSYQIVRVSNDQKSEDYKKFQDGGFSYDDKDTPDKVYAPVKLVDAPGALEAIKNTIRGSTGPVSIGNKDTTRQLINVAPGSADSDAVNVAQLKAVAGAIKHYDVVSPNGDITVTHPDPHDPNKTVWNLDLNPARVKEITKWKLRDVEENGNPKAGQTDALVKGDETVTFQDTDTINVERVGTDGKTLKFHTKKNIKYFSVNSSGGGNENNNGATATDAIAIGKNASSTGSNAVSLGFGAKALGSNNTAIGPGAQAKDVRTTAIGYNAKAEAASAVSIGYEAHATKSRSLAIGQDATASANNAIALGSSGQQSGNDRPNKTTASAEHAVAIGSGAVANIANGIALGSQSNTTAASGQTGFDASQNADGARVNKYTNLTNNNQNVRTSTLAGLSIGDTGKTRQINHLAAGTADDDAVNVAQLKSVNLAFKGDNNTKGDVRLHDQRLSVVGVADSFITTKASDNKLEIGTTQGTFSTTDGKSSATKQGLATTTAVASAINDSGWEVRAKGTKVGLVNPGDKVDFTNADKSIEIESFAEANGLSTIKFKAVTETIQTEEKSPITQIDVNGSTVSKTTKGKNEPTGRFVVPTGDKANKYALATAYDVADKVNQTGWNLYTNGGARSLINPGDYVNFKSGNATNAKVVTEASEGATISYDVNVDNTTIKIDSNGNKLTANTGDIDSVTNTKGNSKKGQVTIHKDLLEPSKTDSGKLATVDTVVKAVNNAKWFAKADNKGDEIADGAETNDADDADGQAMGAGDKLTLKAGKNLRVKRDGANFTFATDNDVTFNKVTSGEVAINNGGKLTVGTGATINMGDNIIHGVKAGEANTDAVNLAQLKANTTTVEAGKNVTVTPDITNNSRKYTVDAEKSIVTATGPVTVESTPNNTDHTTTYNVGLNIDNDSLVVEGGKLKAKTQAQAVESVEKKDVEDNIAEVDLKSGSTKGAANAVYTVAVTKSAVKAAAAWKLKAENGEAQTVSGGETVTFKNSDTINATVSANKEVTLTANTGSIEEVSPSTNTDNTPKKGQVQAKPNDENKVATVSNVANAINKAKWFAKADNNGGEIADDAKTNDADDADGQAMGAGDKLTLKAGKNLRVKRDGANFTFATDNNVTFNKVTSGEVVINNGGKFTVGTGATINMGNNIVGGVKTGVADTDAVNVAQLKSTRTEVKPGNNVTIDSKEEGGHHVYTVNAANTQATVSKKEGLNPISVDGTQKNENGTINYKVGLNIDDGSLEITTDGKLKAKAQGQAIEKVEASADTDNIATVSTQSGAAAGSANETYKVSVSRNTVKDIAKEAINVQGSKYITVSETNENNVETHTVSAQTGYITVTEATGAVTTPTTEGLTTNKAVADAIAKSGFQLKQGEEATAKTVINPGDSLTFKDGQGTKAVINANGDVTINATVAKLTQGDNVTIEDNGDGNFTIKATDTNTQASVSKLNDNSPITIDSSATNSAGAKDYKLDVNVDGTTISKAGGTLHAVTGAIEEVTTTTTGDNAKKKGQVQASLGDESKVATVSNVANAINKAKWFAKADNNGGEIADADKANDAENADGQAMGAGDKLTLKAGKNLRVKRKGANFTFATDNDVTFNKVTSNEFVVNPNGKFTVGSGATINMGNNIIHGVSTGVADTDAVNVAQLKSTERHITPATYAYNDADKSVTLTYTDGNGNLVKNTNAKIDLSGLASKIKDYSFKTNATGPNLVGTGTDTTVALGKSVNFAASDNLTLKQDVNDGNVTYTYSLKNQVVVGEKGTPGADGKPGKDGVDGSIGVNGKDGSAVAINGKDGSIGLNGKDSKNGLTIKGQDGKVGVDGKDGETRLVYVEKADPTKPGSSDKIHELATLDDGMKYGGDIGEVANVKLNKQVDIKGGVTDKTKLSDNNIGVISTPNATTGGTELTVKLAKELKGLTSAEFKGGDDNAVTNITNSGITIKPANSNDDSKTVSLTNTGLNNGGNKITHVAEGKDDTDAVNVKQLKDFKTEVNGYGWNLSVNNGENSSKITKDTTVDLNNDDGNIKIAKNGSNVTLSLGPDVGLGKAGKDGKDGSLAVRGKDGASVEISGKDGSIGLTGPKGKDGTPGASATITVEKGTTTVNDDRDGGKQVNRIVYTDKDKDGNDIKREVATLDDGLKFKGDSKEVINRKLGSQVNITGGADSTKLTENNIGVVYDKVTNGLKVKLSKDVNLGDNGTITIGDTVVNKDGLTINGGPSVTKGGVNAGNQSVTNVKDGAEDNDAVNVKQLKTAKTEVEAGDHIDVTSRVGANGQTIYKVSAKGINDTSAAVKGGSNHVEVTKAANTHKDGSTTVTDYTVDLSEETKNTIRDTHNKVTNEGLTFNADKGTTGVKKLGSKVAVKGDGKNITTTADENGVKVSMEDKIKVNSVTAKEVKVGDVNINENGINAGGKRITNVAPGKDGTDAVNVNQLKYVAGNISNQINNVDKGLRAGIAGALASGGLYHVTTAGKSMVSVGAGTYRGQNALAVGYSRLSDNGKVGVKFTVNSNSQGHSGASASVGYQW